MINQGRRRATTFAFNLMRKQTNIAMVNARVVVAGGQRQCFSSAEESGSQKVSPYFKPTESIQDVKRQHAEREDLPDTNKIVKIGGRVIGRRKASSSLIFLDLESNGHQMQVMLRGEVLQTDKDLANQVSHRGAIIGVEGYPGRTKAGEFSIVATKVTGLAECTQNLPMMNWNHKKTLKDGEKRFQQRHLDFIVNSELKLFFQRRAQIVAFLRKFLTQRDFLEVETPILNAQAGGALAKPFLTHSNELKQDFELRIAPELFLKQLIIGGYERVFEIGKVFRNEGIDATHNPEFSSLEFYMAYADYQDLVELTETLLQELTVEIFGAKTVDIPIFDIDQKTVTEPAKGSQKQAAKLKEQVMRLDVSQPFRKYDVMEELGLDPLDLAPEKLEKLLRPKLIDMLVADNYAKREFIETFNDKQLFDKLIETRIESKISHSSEVVANSDMSETELMKAQPAFIINHPLLMSPLAKSHAQGRMNDSRGAEYLAERFELFFDGMELINAYSEQNDAKAQTEAFRLQTQEISQSEQSPGQVDEELHRNDQAFLDALSIGMAPTAGWGCGIDRLCMVFCGLPNIREAILFPMFRTSLLGKGNKDAKKKQKQ